MLARYELARGALICSRSFSARPKYPQQGHATCHSGAACSFSVLGEGIAASDQAIAVAKAIRNENGNSKEAVENRSKILFRLRGAAVAPVLLTLLFGRAAGPHFPCSEFLTSGRCELA